jgi:xylulokinase
LRLRKLQSNIDVVIKFVTGQIMAAYLLGIDIGTSSVKTAVVDAESAAIVHSATQEYPVLQPQPGYAEQNPDDWWNAVVQTVRATTETIDKNAIIGIGLSGQMHGTVCLDQTGEPMRPAIIWADTRSKPQCDALMGDLDEMARYAPGRPAAGFMGPTLMWLAQHEPETLAHAGAVILPKDEVRRRLTGEIATEVSDAAATWLLEIKTSQWSDWLLDACGLEHSYMPTVLQSTDIAGKLTPNAAALLGLPTGIPVIAGCADQPAQALAYGLYAPGTALVTIGTGGQVFLPLLQPQTDPHMRFYVFNHALPERWYAAAAILSAGLSLRWLRDLLGLKDRADAYEHLSKLASSSPPGAEGLIFLPYLAGERTPHFDPQASGVFLGLRLHHHGGHMARAVMEGVTFALNECLSLVANPNAQLRVIISGGASASPVWRQIQADIFNRPLTLSAGANHACTGAALLAGVGCGVYSSIDDACSRLPQASELISPNPENVAFYIEQGALYRGLYDTLKPDMHRLSALRKS